MALGEPGEGEVGEGEVVQNPQASPGPAGARERQAGGVAVVHPAGEALGRRPAQHVTVRAAASGRVKGEGHTSRILAVAAFTPPPTRS